MVKRSNPPTPKKKVPKAPKAPKVVKQSNNYCRRCEQNDEYLDVINDRIETLESLVNKLTNTEIYNNNISKPLSNIGIENLVNLSNQIHIELFQRFEMHNQLQLQTQIATPITKLTPPQSINQC
ncbi:13955_t:CDS:1 [Funneliformis geosporum]|uniref:19264_t:CDS:1 n=1 Tax=Funneliformis geosporum TaxID=1117311 RepID=A0A9W4WMW8_9GLOM|nr:19264_t:CDS:1 [Funneliformis geosporum]CAI2174591.1 13955_t:CDS:1 [Funneliformis geosporum]